MLNQDKLYHFLAGSAVALLFGLVVATVVALGKELYDRKHGTPDWNDFIATVAGALWVLNFGPSLITYVM